jgi:hypothetical protein
MWFRFPCRHTPQGVGVVIDVLIFGYHYPPKAGERELNTPPHRHTRRAMRTHRLSKNLL